MKVILTGMSYNSLIYTINDLLFYLNRNKNKKTRQYSLLYHRILKKGTIYSEFIILRNGQIKKVHLYKIL